MPDNQTNSSKNDATDSPASATRGKRLGEVAILFLRMGLTAFGGPAAHIALIEEECVRRRGWLSRELRRQLGRQPEFGRVLSLPYC